MQRSVTELLDYDEQLFCIALRYDVRLILALKDSSAPSFLSLHLSSENHLLITPCN
jgi:hypothetical protein